MKTHERIKYLREKAGLSQGILAEMVGYRDRSSIAKVEAGLVDLPQSKISALAKALNTNIMFLLERTDDESPEYCHPDNIIPMPATRELPLLGNIACGEPILAEENLDGTVSCPEHVAADFALRCKGDSMINARIFDGDIVYIRQQPQVDDGQIAAVLIGDEATLKRVRLFSDHISLEPENPQYRPIVLWGEEMATVRILGLAVAFTGPVQ